MQHWQDRGSGSFHRDHNPSSSAQHTAEQGQKLGHGERPKAKEIRGSLKGDAAAQPEGYWISWGDKESCSTRSKDAPALPWEQWKEPAIWTTPSALANAQLMQSTC